MTLMEAMVRRHSVRSYTDRKIEGDVLEQLNRAIDECNREGGLNIQLRLEEPEMFTGFLARYGKFTGVRNYIALIGKKGAGLEEKCGYYGEKLVLLAEQLGLSTCWIGGTYSKGRSKAVVNSGEKRALIIAIGYGAAAGVPHKAKPVESFYSASGALPDWFRKGVETAQYVPTALNQQKFHFELIGEDVVKAAAGFGPFAKVDLGIAKYHFEVGAGDGNWRWA